MFTGKPKIAYLAFDMLTPGVSYHAAFVSGRVRPYTPPHTHDFYEMFYLLEGSLTHTINGETEALTAGDLVMVRPQDCHSLAGKRFHMINVAFRADSWRRFCSLVGLDASEFVDVAVAPPPSIHVPETQRQECAAIFGRILNSFQHQPHGRSSRQILCWFWSAALEFLLPDEREAAGQNEARPVWLSHACRAMCEEENLRAGLSRFVDVSGVTRAHLTRTLRAYRDQTPTEFVNEVRLRRAAMLLATTPAEIIDIAIDCGFENLSYFYRRFRRQYGKSPRVWRIEAQCIEMPLSE